MRDMEDALRDGSIGIDSMGNADSWASVPLALALSPAISALAICAETMCEYFSFNAFLR